MLHFSLIWFWFWFCSGWRTVMEGQNISGYNLSCVHHNMASTWSTRIPVFNCFLWHPHAGYACHFRLAQRGTTSQPVMFFSSSFWQSDILNYSNSCSLLCMVLGLQAWSLTSGVRQIAITFNSQNRLVDASFSKLTSFCSISLKFQPEKTWNS